MEYNYLSRASSPSIFFGRFLSGPFLGSKVFDLFFLEQIFSEPTFFEQFFRGQNPFRSVFCEQLFLVSGQIFGGRNFFGTNFFKSIFRGQLFWLISIVTTQPWWKNTDPEKICQKKLLPQNWSKKLPQKHLDPKY